MNVLPREKRILVLRCLSEGMGINPTARVTNVARATVLSLLEQAGPVCAEHHDRMVRNLPCRRVQIDEIWSFVFCKEKNAPTAKTSRYCGDVWTWTALCADTRLLVTWLLGDRSATCARDVMLDLKQRLVHPRFQLTTDGLGSYLEAVDYVYGTRLDYAQLVKEYGSPPPPQADEDRKYSPSRLRGIHKTAITGMPAFKDISTSYVERANLSIRMRMRRFTRLTNGHSKKLENHAHAMALFAFDYNFVRIHESLRVTPAMEAGMTDRLWDLSDVVKFIEEATPPPGPRGPYRKQEISN